MSTCSFFFFLWRMHKRDGKKSFQFESPSGDGWRLSEPVVLAMPKMETIRMGKLIDDCNQPTLDSRYYYS